jgi:hypothetical protein
MSDIGVSRETRALHARGSRVLGAEAATVRCGLAPSVARVEASGRPHIGVSRETRTFDAPEGQGLGAATVRVRFAGSCWGSGRGRACRGECWALMQSFFD